MKALYETGSRKRLMALVVLAAVLVITLFSSCFVIREADHVCSDAACPVCAMLEQCERNLRQLGTGQILIIAVIAAICGFLFVSCYSVPALSTDTPISWKVRLNN